MKNDTFGLLGNFHWKHYDKDGNFLEEGGSALRECGHNQIQNNLKSYVSDCFVSATLNYIDYIAIGTGTGQAVGDSALASKASAEAVSPTDSGTSGITTNAVTFTATASWTITEGGVFADGAGDAEMYLYSDDTADWGVSGVSLATDDTLQVTWTLDYTACP